MEEGESEMQVGSGRLEGTRVNERELRGRLQDEGVCRMENWLEI